MRHVFVVGVVVVAGACIADDTDTAPDRGPAEGRTSTAAGGSPAGGADGASSSSAGTSSGGSGGQGQPPAWCGFGDEIAFTLPTGFATDQLDDPEDNSSATCGQGELSFGLRDMDGDERPDLVVSDACDHTGVGTTHWKVYPNEGDRFSPAATTWPLPSGFVLDQLDDLEDDGGGTCGQGELSMTTRDLDGDRRADLIVTDHCDHAGVGTTHWEVFLNDGSGFAPVIAWSLPPGFGTDWLDDATEDTSTICGVGQFASALIDMDGDFRPELVVTDRCDLGGVGTEQWWVFANTGSGFSSSPAPWSLPSGFGTDGLRKPARDDAGFCGQGELSYGLRDYDGDRRPDLVVADRCDHDDVGTTRWQVFANQGHGFDVPTDWPLPTAGFGIDQLDDLAAHDVSSCGVGMFGAFTLDVDGDDDVDLLVTDDCDHEGVGTTHWRSYENTNGSFAPATSWSLPRDFGFDPFDRVVRDGGDVCGQGEFSSIALDLNGDRILDLVVTDDCDHAEVGTTHWRLFPGRCPAP